jgi:hypothetical protein
MNSCPERLRSDATGREIMAVTFAADGICVGAAAGPLAGLSMHSLAAPGCWVRRFHCEESAA